MLSTRSSQYSRATLKQRRADERRRMCFFSVGCLATLLALVYVVVVWSSTEPLSLHGHGSLLAMVGLPKGAVPTEKPPPAQVIGANGTT
jgi:hypothetical protein